MLRQRLAMGACFLLFALAPLATAHGQAPALNKASSANQTSAAQKAPRPNVVVILADDLGVSDLASWGATDLRTPHLDRLATQGLRFENFYANCCVCSPTRAALLTGRYPDLVGVPGVIRTRPADNWGFLSPSAVTLPDLLSRAGYHTALVGKWHLGLAGNQQPTARGFAQFHGFLGDMMDDYFQHRRHGINYLRRNLEEIDPPGHATDLFTDWACAYLRERKAAQQPFFLYLAYNAPHTPLQPRPDWLKKVQEREPTLPEKRAKLAGLIEHLDEGVGRVLQTLEETGLSQNTIVIFTSDNGGDLGAGARNAPWRDGKGSHYEGGLRVPMVAAWPGHIPAGSRTARVSVTMDLFPTILEAAGLESPGEINGASFYGTLLAPQPGLAKQTDAKQTEPERTLIFMRREGGPRFAGLAYYAIRQGVWKFVQAGPWSPWELYNLENDPQETRDLAPQQPQRVREFLTILQRHVQQSGAVPWQDPAAPVVDPVPR